MADAWVDIGACRGIAEMVDEGGLDIDNSTSFEQAQQAFEDRDRVWQVFDHFDHVDGVECADGRGGECQ